MNLYFDNAATTRPKPACVGDAMAHALLRCGNPGRGGHHAAMAAAEVIWNTREQAAALFGARPQDVVFTGNCTESINTVLRGLLAEGGHAVISDVEHNAVIRPLTEWHIPYSVAATYPGDTRSTLAAFAAAIRPDTRLIFCTHASNVTGQLLPIRAIGRLAHDRGLPFAVDAAQTAGLVPLSLTANHIDLLCAPGHKGLLGPTGTGLLVSSQKVPLRPLIAGGTGSFSLLPTQPEEWPERMESGTPNVPGIAGLGAAISWLRGRQGTLAAHEWTLGQQLWEGLRRQPGIRVHTACPHPGLTVPLVLFSVEDESSEQTAERLAGQGLAVRAGLHCAPTAHRKLGTLPDGAVRAAIGPFHTAADVEFLCKKVRPESKKGIANH